MHFKLKLVVLSIDRVKLKMKGITFLSWRCSSVSSLLCCCAPGIFRSNLPTLSITSFLLSSLVFTLTSTFLCSSPRSCCCAVATSWSRSKSVYILMLKWLFASLETTGLVEWCISNDDLPSLCRRNIFLPLLTIR